MSHLTDGQLRAHLDSELHDADARHLAACGECQARLDALAGQRRAVVQHLAALAPRTTGPAPDSAWQRFQHKVQAQSEKEKLPMSKKLWPRLRPALALVVVLTVIIAAFTVAPVQQAFSAFLGLFRVQQITVLPIDTSNLESLAGNEALGEQMARMFSDNVTVTREAGEPQTAAGAAEASQLAGFTVRTVETDLAGPQFRVASGAAFEFVVNRGEAQALINEMGRSDLQLPASLDGATISVDIPTGVVSVYGDCPQFQPMAEGGPRRAFSTDCVMLTQVPSPSVNTPPDVNVAALAEIALQITGMSAEEARAFSRTIDWTSTLVLPIPRNAVVNQEVSVDGVTGQLLAYGDPDEERGYYTIVWAKDGLLYSLSGYNGPAQGLALANSLR
jgi:predicted anti-sigma-YlaC factor YlaD